LKERGVARRRRRADDKIVVATSCIEFADGSIGDGGVFEAPALHVDGKRPPLSSSAVRELAAKLIEAADEIDAFG
jgi:hypothetical protein